MPRGKRLTTKEPEAHAMSLSVTELERATDRQKELLDLRGKMASEGIDSISKLDALLSEVNERVRKLS